MRVTSSETRFPKPTSENWKAIGLVVVLVCSASGGVLFAIATPSTNIPVGIARTGGISMSPTYGETGVAVYGPGSFEQGDVIVYHDASADKYIMHRIVGQTEQGFVTQGDAYTQTDQSLGRPYVTPENRVGEVYLVVDSKGIHLPAF